MIQDIAPMRFDNAYLSDDNQPRLHDICFIFRDNTVYASNLGGSLELLTYGMISSRQKKLTYLFRIDDTRYYLTDCEVQRYGYKFIPVRELRYAQPKFSVFALMTAYHLYTWYNNNKFCGRCGKEMTHDPDMRALNCSCGNQVFPTIAPAVIVAVVNDNRLLLTKYRGRAFKKYALIAGFAEIGETLEDTVRREVMEETGLSVTRLRYYKSQPWGVDSNLLVGFFARLEGSDVIEIDENELSEAAWFRREDIDQESDGISLTSEMIQAFRDGYTG